MTSISFVRQCARALLLLVGAAATHASAQTLESRPNLDLLVEGQVRAMLREPDGSLIVGGDFSRIRGSVRRNLARILPDGSIDPAWAPTVGAARYAGVTALARGADGAIYIAGNFGEVDGVTRLGMAKVSAAGLLDPAWAPRPNGTVDAMHVDAAGRVYVAGSFAAFGTTSRPKLARLSGSDGTVDTDWAPTVDAGVSALLLGADGASIYIGGWFTQVNGQVRGHVAKLSTASGAALDPAWHPAADNAVFALAHETTSTLLIAGQFATIGGTPRASIARVATTGAGVVDAAWAPDVWGAILTLDVTADWVYAGGIFGRANDLSHRFLARMPRIGKGAIDTQWRPAPDTIIDVLDVDAAGVVHVGGRFLRIGALPAIGLARIGPAGNLAAALDVVLPGQVLALAAQPDGGVLVGGRFRFADGLPRENLLRLLPDGGLDPAWTADANEAVRALAVSPNGAIYAGGDFSTIAGAMRPAIARLRADGSVDAAWGPTSVDGGVSALSLDRGRLYLAGSFAHVNGESFGGFARLAADGTGTADPAWRPLPDAAYAGATVHADGAGHVYVGGYFASIGGVASKGFARLSDVDARADPAFDLQLDGNVEAIAHSARGVVVAGSFTQARGQVRLGIARLLDDGSIDAGFAASVEYGAINAVDIDAAGRVHAAGSFYVANGAARFGLVRFFPDGALDLTWAPQPDYPPEALIVQRERILLGGAFGSIAAQPRAGLAAFFASDLTHWLEPIHVDSFE